MFGRVLAKVFMAHSQVLGSCALPVVRILLHGVTVPYSNEGSFRLFYHVESSLSLSPSSALCVRFIVIPHHLPNPNHPSREDLQTADECKLSALFSFAPPSSHSERASPTPCLLSGTRSRVCRGLGCHHLAALPVLQLKMASRGCRSAS